MAASSGLPKNEDQKSQTLSVISPATITLTGSGSVEKDAASQQTAPQLTSRDASTANGALTNSLTLQQAQELEVKLKETQQNVQAAQMIVQVAQQFGSDVADSMKAQAARDKMQALSLQEQARKAESLGDVETAEKLNNQATTLLSSAEKTSSGWETGGTYRQATQAAIGALTGLLNGNVKEAAANAAAPYLATMVKDLTTTRDGNGEEHVNLAANVMAHALLGGVLAGLGDKDATAGAVGAGSAPLMARAIAKTMYNSDDPETLNDAQKAELSQLTMAAGGMVGLVVSKGVLTDAATAAAAAKNEVENNAERMYDLVIRGDLDKLRKAKPAGKRDSITVSVQAAYGPGLSVQYDSQSGFSLTTVKGKGADIFVGQTHAFGNIPDGISSQISANYGRGVAMQFVTGVSKNGKFSQVSAGFGAGKFEGAYIQGQTSFPIHFNIK